MHKLLLVGWREFIQRVRTRGFIIGSLAVPLVLIVVGAFTGAFEKDEQQVPLDDLITTEHRDLQIGYVDHANFIKIIPDPIPSGIFQTFTDEDTAVVALERGEIQAFYIVTEDYPTSGEVQRVSKKLPALPPDTDWFNWVLIANLFPDASPEQITRLYWPFNNSTPEFINLDASDKQESRSNPMLPFVVTIAVMMPLFTSGGFLLQSLTQEKGSRIMEILLLSLRPWHLLAGKLVGLAGLTLVQYLIWGVIAGFSLGITGQDPLPLLEAIQLSSMEAMLVVPYALGGFLLYAGFMAGIGALSPDMEGSRSWVFMISLPMMIPIYLWSSIVNAPEGTLAVALSMIPFSAPVAMLMRMTSSIVPTWQLVTSLVLLVLTGIGMVWLMARFFRVQILLSGEKLSLKRFYSAIRG